MKIYTEVVFNMRTMEVESDESFEYEGEIAHLGGGTDSGFSDQDWPEYLKIRHAQLIDYTRNAIHPPAGYTPNPWSGLYPWGPDGAIRDITNAIQIYDARTQAYYHRCAEERKFDGLSYTEEIWDTLMADGGEAAVRATLESVGADLSFDIETTVLPRFHAGMRDINAVQSSAFVIGDANIEMGRQRALEKLSAAAHSEIQLQYPIKKAEAMREERSLRYQFEGNVQEHQRNINTASMEMSRLTAIMKQAEFEMKSNRNENHNRWYFEMRMYEAKALAAISGASPMSSSKEAGASVSGALGAAVATGAAGAGLGATIGAATASGASVGAWWGAGIGAVVGLGMYFMQ